MKKVFIPSVLDTTEYIETKAALISFLSALAVFVHYKATSVILFICGVFIAVNKKTNRLIFQHKSAFIPFAFLAINFITAFIYQNQKGFRNAVVFLMVTIIGLYLRSVMTRTLFEQILDLLCIGCIPVFIGALIWRAINLSTPNFRLTLWFCNSNYLASILAAIVIICAYKVSQKKGFSLYYYAIASGCAICIFFTGSMFAWIEIFMGVSVLLTLTKKHQLLGTFLIICVVGCLFIYCVPEIFPRLTESNITTENRVLIWKDAIHYIPEHLWFGKGFFTYGTLPNLSYPTTHAHNIFLEPLLSFGIVGSALILLFFTLYYRSVILCNKLLRKSHITSLILAVSAAVLIHSTTDMTMIWSQTSCIYAIIMAGLGVDEQTLAHIRSSRNLITSKNNTL